MIGFLAHHPLSGPAVLPRAELPSSVSTPLPWGGLDTPAILAAWQDFLSHWPAYVRLPISAGIVEHAAAIAQQHGLRAYDAIHLASALAWEDVTGDEVVFACYDENLAKAAGQEGLQVWPGHYDTIPPQR